MNSPSLMWKVLLLLCLHQHWCAAALPIDDWTEDIKKASSHEHWEHIVKRSSYHAHYQEIEDDTAHIVNVQDYYRSVFSEGWDNYRDNERDLFNLLTKLEAVVQQGSRASSQGVKSAIEFGLHTKPIKGRYIVMFQSGADDYTLDRTIAVMQRANLASNMKIRATDMSPLRYVGKAFTATLNSKAVELMEKHPAVAHIEEDVALRRSDIFTHEESDSMATGSHVLWNLDRLDQRDNILDQSYDPEGSGKDVDVYIIDTGVRGSHKDLAGRVHYAGFDAVDHLTGSNNQGQDCNGHGTHCAGTVAGTTYGVAKKATIYNLRALNCEGTGAVSGIVMGIDRIVKQKLEGGSGKPIVISQSLGVKKSVSLNTAIKEATDAGIVCVGAAGNQAGYSCDYSPASATMGISVGATDKEDEVTTFTNTGECTTIMAPGAQITSASHKCDTCTKTMSGTSMAGPHAAGYAAIVMSQNPSMTPAEVMAKMIKQSTKDKVMMSSIESSRSHSTPNRLLYVRSVKEAMKEDSHDRASIQAFNSRP